MKKLFSYLLISSMVVLSSCTNYDDQFDDLNTQINALKTQIAGFSSLSTGLTSLQGTVASLQSAVANIPATDLSGLESDLTDLSALVKALQAQVAATATALEAGTVSDAAIAAAIKVVQDNQAALDTAVAAVTAAQATLATAADVAAVTAAQTAADAAAVKLAAAVADLATELTALGTTNAELKTVTDLIQASVALLTDGQASNTKSIATLVDAVAALDTASLSTLINTLSTSVTSSTADILAAILAGNNVYTSGSGASALQINSAASLAVAESLGTKLGIINGGITITHTKAAAMDAAKLQAVLDNITTVTGVVTYTHSGDVTAVNFSKLSSAGTLEIDAEHAISLPELSTVTNELKVVDDNKVTSFSAPKLTSVGNFNDGANDHDLTLSRATSIDLSSLSYYDAVTNLEITGNALSAGWDLDMPLFQTKTSAGVTRGAFTLTIGGYVNLVELDAMTSSADFIAAPLANKVVLDNFQGTVTGNHVDVTLGAAKKAYTSGTRTEKVNITGVLTSASTTTDKAEGPAFTFGSTSVKLTSATIAGEAGAVSFNGNTNVETVVVSANSVSVDFTNATSLVTATVSGNVRGDIDFDRATSLTDATLSGATNGSVLFVGNTSLTNVAMTGSANTVSISGAAVLTSLDLGHSTASSVADATKGIANAAKDQAGALHVFDNAELVSLKADKVATIGSLKVYKNPNLASVSFDGISAPAAAYTGKTVIHVGATVDPTTNFVTAGTANTSNKLIAQSIVETEGTTLADGSPKARGTITTNSGLSDLAAMITAARADLKNDVAVFFDGIDSYTTLAGSTTTDRDFSNDPNKVTIANFATLTNGTDTQDTILEDRLAESFTITNDLTLTYNGKSVTFDASTYDTEALYLSALEGQTTIDGVSIDTGKIDQQGRVAIVTEGTAALGGVKLILNSTSKSASYTSTAEIFVTIAPTYSSTDSSTVAAQIATALNGASIGVYSGTVATVSNTVAFNTKYKAIAYANSIAIVPMKKITTAALTYAYVVDRTAAPVDFMLYETSANVLAFATIHTEVNNYYIQLTDTADNTSTIGTGAITGNSVTYDYGSGTTVDIDADAVYASGLKTFDKLTGVNAAASYYVNGLTIGTEYYEDGDTSNARTLLSTADVYFNTTYYTWN